MKKCLPIGLCSSMVILLTGCGGGSGSGAGAGGEPAAPAPEPESQFVNVTAASGIHYIHGYLNPTPNSMIEMLSGGVAAGDYDNDGDIDLFIVRGDLGPNLLYRNEGDNTFVDVASAAGLAFTRSAAENYRHSGPAFADMDGDGDLDLFIGGIQGDPSLVYKNNGDGSFSDVTSGSGIDTMTAVNSVSAAFGDYDRDGDLDMFVAHWGTPRTVGSPEDTEHLWRNVSADDRIRFTSVSEPAGISPSIIVAAGGVLGSDHDYTFTPTFADINDDGYPDILSVADFDATQVFINNLDGTFTNTTDEDVIVDKNGMGSAVGDYDGDGDLDWFVTGIWGPGEVIGNRLYNNQNGEFTDVTFNAGVEDGSWGWGACFADFDNDGDLDIYHTNGWQNSSSLDKWENDASRLFISNGDGTFTDMAQKKGVVDRQQGRGVVCADFDNDGDVDIFVTHRSLNNSASLWRNDIEQGNYLKVKLRDSGNNSEAVGARITVVSGDRIQIREVNAGNNFTSQNPTPQIFGMGKNTQADTVEIMWPDGVVQTYHDVAVNQTLIYTRLEP